MTPDLAGRAADTNTLSRESTTEQRNCGLFDLSQEEKASMRSLNKAYKDKFGFPFVICVRDNTKESIIHAMKERYRNDKQKELLNGLKEAKKIAFLRLLDIITTKNQFPLATASKL